MLPLCHENVTLVFGICAKLFVSNANKIFTRKSMETPRPHPNRLVSDKIQVGGVLSAT